MAESKPEKKKGFIINFFDDLDKKMEQKSKKQCCGKGGCCK